MVCVSSNYFSEKCKEQTSKALEKGETVTFCASCIGHTRAMLFEVAGERFVIEKYGKDNVEITYPSNGYESAHYRLKNRSDYGKEQKKTNKKTKVRL